MSLVIAGESSVGLLGWGSAVCVVPGLPELRLHCTDLEGCDGCLQMIVEVLAMQMDWDLESARDVPAEVYQRLLGEERCSRERAMEFRRRVCSQCAWVRGMDQQSWIADELPPAPAKFETFGQTGAARWMLIAMVLGVVAVVLLVAVNL